MRVRRFNARKDCLVCIVGVIAGGHYDQGRDTECKAYYYYFYIWQFCLCLRSAWLHINTDFDDDDDATAADDELVKWPHFFTWIMMMIAVLTKYRQLSQIGNIYGLTIQLKDRILVEYEY